jgi:nucleoside-diphosphate-sugar epimerase
MQAGAMACDSEFFILGGAGLVGSAVARACAAARTSFTIIGRDNYAAMKGRACDIFVNANGSSRKLLATRDPVADFDANVRSVRASLVDFAFRRYVHISSCDVYPDCASPATTSEDGPLNPASQSAYGFHKYLAEQCVRHSAADWLILRCGGFVGPGLKKNAIFDILSGGPLYLDPASELQFLHTDRAAEIVLDLLRRDIRNDVLNVCGKGIVRLSEVAAISPTPIAVQPGSPVVRYEISLEKLSRHLEPPETRPEVLGYVRQQLAARAAR